MHIKILQADETRVHLAEVRIQDQDNKKEPDSYRGNKIGFSPKGFPTSLKSQIKSFSQFSQGGKPINLIYCTMNIWHN